MLWKERLDHFRHFRKIGGGDDLLKGGGVGSEVVVRGDGERRGREYVREQASDLCNPALSSVMNE